MNVIQNPPRQRGKATYQDVIDAPPHKIAEIVDGRLYTHSRPPPLQTSARSVFGCALGALFHRGRGGPGGWRIVLQPELRFGTPPDEDILVPDIVGWRRERIPTADTDYYALTPDWVCEVLSPITQVLDIGRKRDIYAREGVPCLWHVEPVFRTLEAFELHNGKWTLTATLTGDAPVSVPPFESFGEPLNSLWE